VPPDGTSAARTAAPVREAPPIIRPGANTWRTATADAAGVIVDAADYYHAFYHAVREARHYVLMSGWQFDSGVPLLRGADAPPGEDVRFLGFMDGLCERNPDLHVYILAWDFHLVFAGEREWMQRVLFHWMTNARFRFRFDDAPVPGGSHHQKFVVVDGALAFLGGMDVCEARWDDRRHLAANPLRTSRGRPAKPYHDVQAYLAGGTAPAALRELFRERWATAGGDPLVLTEDPDAFRPPVRPRGAIPLDGSCVALSRTDPRPGGPAVREVEALFVDAIDAAEALIYAETQYFSSRRICAALERRMRRADRPRLEIVIVVNERAEALKEELAVGLRQAENLARLRRVAAETGHALGLYHSRCAGAGEGFEATYIHSKLLVVDDRFLTVGSANLTNRSMGVDSELHASWEVPRGHGGPAARAIQRVRLSLLAEHCGIPGGAAIRALAPVRGLVKRLDEWAQRPGARLQRHGPPTPVQAAVLELVDPQALPFDPEAAGADEAGRDEPADDARRHPSAITRLAQALWRRLRRSRP
jgi:phosphatidylserine/phosphatidylglycerophosphate/cardiolipin synthase-like enzyme